MNLYQPDLVTHRSGHIGARQTRVEDAALLRGLGCYADDAATRPVLCMLPLSVHLIPMRASLPWTSPKRC